MQVGTMELGIRMFFTKIINKRIGISRDELIQRAQDAISVSYPDESQEWVNQLTSWRINPFGKIGIMRTGYTHINYEVYFKLYTGEIIGKPIRWQGFKKV